MEAGARIFPTDNVHLIDDHAHHAWLMQGKARLEAGRAHLPRVAANAKDLDELGKDLELASPP
jgi:hypothetical protein